MRPVDAPGRRSGRSAMAVASSPRARAWPAVHRHRRNNGAAGAAINTLVAVQGLWIIAASVTLRLLRPPAAAAPPVRSGREVARPVTNNMSTGICAAAAGRRRPPGRSPNSADLSRSVTAVRCDLARLAA